MAETRRAPHFMHSQSLLASHDLGSAIADLGQGANWLAGASLSRLRELADECSLGVVRVAKDWVRAACEAKHIGFDQPVAAEEILSGRKKQAGALAPVVPPKVP